ncbi:MAG TPA: YjjW family glycine radical enzyme activase [Negativicutes bacterium]|nr:YjjW family glycine radical enzyme activase [Negativicutes bacterium]
MSEALVNRIIPFSSVDGPGNRLVVFFQGCNFNCLYCHNPETINICSSCGRCLAACPAGALASTDGKLAWDPAVCVKCDACLAACDRKSSPKAVYMTVENIMKKINRVRPFISGITVSGGECTLEKDFLVELIDRAHESGLTVFLDTNGSIDFSSEEKLTASMDKVMLDIKSLDEEEHIRLTGVSNAIVLKNAEYLVGLNKLYEIRTVIVPELLDNSRNVDGISKLIARLDPDIRYKLISFRPVGVVEAMRSIPVPSDVMMQELKKMAESNGCHNVLIV